ncbi:SDR family NAD(P)-dependent oxidoreductase [Aeromicrobium wangtongii]|uniref:SDR family NAD(P)-dependent oxidoreductase n=1 Tax=Aeromicrobium wangtongii TaxID=2969247 RepID=UPI002018118B|nr:SDR family NAD(P)-dependent oxidoreductase [Aeromicrobium wangtongii]MCL3819842.1 SDR family NAD(P)-dependent oxidoreductase [Aeromicrobium wangtongii]
MSSISLTDRVAVVTGAGGGLGRIYALALARAGAAVVVNDTGGALDGGSGQTSPAQSVVDEILAAGGAAIASTTSVATPEGGEAIVDTAVEAFGSLDIVVNNAGILRDRSFAKIDWDDFHAVHDVHLRGSAYVSRPAFRKMQEQGYGRLVFVSSNAGTFGNFGQSAYGSAKAGIIGLSGVLAIEGARSGVLSNVVCPIARTRMTEGIFESDSAYAPEQIAPLVVYLASEACTQTHMVVSAGGGHFSRVVTGLSEGWTGAPDEPVTAEDVATHIEQILDTSQISVPMSAADELQGLSDRLNLQH